MTENCGFRLLINAIMGIPTLLVVFWVMSLLSFGVGFVMPYLFLIDETSLSLVKVLVYGTLFHVTMGFITFLTLWLDNIGITDTNSVLPFAFGELAIIMFYVAWRAVL